MKNAPEARPYLIFSLGQEKFAINVDHVQEVVEVVPITKVPNVPDFMLGIINLRGRVLPLLDTRVKLNLPKKEVTKKSRILILDIPGEDNKNLEIGALVDVANEVVSIREADIQEAPAVEMNKQATPITGLLNDNGDITMIIDISRVFSLQDIIQVNNN
ncbi:MAG: chemotaxis protein CheW [Bacteroidota bacterium]